MNRNFPFPLGMKGTCYEVNDGLKTRFFEIFYVEYDPSKIDRLTNMGVFKESRIAEYLEYINPEMIHDSIFFLYKFETYCCDPMITDPWEFNEAITEYERHYFSQFDDVVEMCKNKWGVDPMDFVNRKDTNIHS